MQESRMTDAGSEQTASVLEDSLRSEMGLTAKTRSGIVRIAVRLNKSDQKGQVRMKHSNERATGLRPGPEISESHGMKKIGFRVKSL